MKALTYSMHNPERFACFQQIAAHVGGMTLAFVRHRRVNWTFHYRGICRAISSNRLLSPKEAETNPA